MSFMSADPDFWLYDLNIKSKVKTCNVKSVDQIPTFGSQVSCHDRTNSDVLFPLQAAITQNPNTV